MNKPAVILTPINEAEAVIEPFWDGRLNGFPLWSIDQGIAHGLRVSQEWCLVGFEWQRRPESGPALRMTRRFDVDCRDYDRLVVSVMAPPGTVLRVTAQTDKGIRQFCSPPSPPLKQEHVLELQGASRLEAVTLEIDAATELRKEFGIEAARIILGHHSAAVTEIYAEKDEQEAIAAIMKVG
jgi:hypothetical protein